MAQWLDDSGSWGAQDWRSHDRVDGWAMERADVLKKLEWLAQERGFEKKKIADMEKQLAAMATHMADMEQQMAAQATDMEQKMEEKTRMADTEMSRRPQLQHTRVEIVGSDGEDELLERLHHVGAALRAAARGGGLSRGERWTGDGIT